MGVYIYKSNHIDAIKIGHYSKDNAWSRVAHRGFYSCICPYEIKTKVSVDDLTLLCWYPQLTSKDEKNIHNNLTEFRICGEWFRGEALEKIKEIICEANKAELCSKEDALKTKRRL